MAVMGSSAPKIDVGIEPINFIDKFKNSIEQIVGKIASKSANSHKSGAFRGSRFIPKFTLEIKTTSPNKRT